MSIIALREKLLAVALILVLVGTIWMTRRQQTHDRHRSMDVLPKPPKDAELARTYPLAPLQMEALQRTEPFGAYASLVDEDPFVRVQTGEAGPATASAPEPASASEYLFRGRILMGGKQLAIIETVGTKETVFIGVGQEIDGLKVVDIAEDRVVLSKPPDQQVILRPAEAAGRQDNKGARESQ